MYGHPQGDIALQTVSEKILSYIKHPNDYAFRLGGEEFALIFSDLDIDKTKRFLERIRKGIESLEILHEKSSVSDCLTVSAGACVIDATTNADEEALYIEANKALYMAKENRNTVIVNPFNITQLKQA